MFNPDTSPQSNFFMRSIGAAGSPLGIAVTATPIRTTSDIEPAIENFALLPNCGLILPTDSFTRPRFKFIADVANRHRLPSLAHSFLYAKDGGLIYYGTANPDSAELGETFRRAANYVGRILKGERPGDLPVQNPTTYRLVINMKTANALGLTIPPNLLALADEVIE